jgi:hypothetical protein
MAVQNAPMTAANRLAPVLLARSPAVIQHAVFHHVHTPLLQKSHCMRDEQHPSRLLPAHTCALCLQGTTCGSFMMVGVYVVP